MFGGEKKKVGKFFECSPVPVTGKKKKVHITPRGEGGGNTDPNQEGVKLIAWNSRREFSFSKSVGGGPLVGQEKGILFCTILPS